MKVVLFGWASSVHIQRWARGLAGRGLEVRVVSLGGGPIEGIDTTIIQRKGRLSYVTQAAEAVEAARQFQPDIVHAHYATGFAWWAARTPIRPRVVSVWGADVIDFVKTPFAKMIIRRLLNRADYVTATSELLRKVCLDLDGGLQSRLSVIPFGVDIPEQIAPLPDDPDFKICYLKGHRKKYGPDILLKAFKQGLQKNPKMHLTMAGEGEMTSELKALAESLGVADKVTFTGFIDNRKVAQLLKDHHLMVMPSTMASESFGVAVLEASACGRPVVASRIGGVPEVLMHGTTGLLVPPSDISALSEAIVRLADNRSLCREMGEAGYRFVKEKYDWEKSLDMMISLYERLIRER